MADESETAELRRRISVLEQDAEGERTVSRHTMNDVEGAVLDLTKAVANLRALSGYKTKRETVEAALELLVRLKSQEAIRTAPLEAMRSDQ